MVVAVAVSKVATFPALKVVKSGEVALPESYPVRAAVTVTEKVVSVDSPVTVTRPSIATETAPP